MILYKNVDRFQVNQRSTAKRGRHLLITGPAWLSKGEEELTATSIHVTQWFGDRRTITLPIVNGVASSSSQRQV